MSCSPDRVQVPEHECCDHFVPGLNSPTVLVVAVQVVPEYGDGAAESVVEGLLAGLVAAVRSLIILPKPEPQQPQIRLFFSFFPLPKVGILWLMVVLFQGNSTGD